MATLSRTAALLLALAACMGASQAGALPSAPELPSFDADALYGGRWSARQMLGAELYTQGAQSLGRVTDFVIGADGAVHTVIVRHVAGDGGERWLAVPWPDVRLAPDLRSLHAPGARASAPGYELLNRAPSPFPVVNLPDEWRLHALLGDFAATLDAPRYGIVTDVLFDGAGEARALIVSRGAGTWGDAGAFAYPWQGAPPCGNRYSLPFRSDNTIPLQRFDYARLESANQLMKTNLSLTKEKEIP